MVPEEGLEPSIPCGPRILSPVRIPIPPPRRKCFLEVPMGVEPMNGGFANRSVRPLRQGTIRLFLEAILF